MGQSREHSGHRSDAMIRIVDAREHYDTRKEYRPRQRLRITTKIDEKGETILVKKEWVKGAWEEVHDPIYATEGP